MINKNPYFGDQMLTIPHWPVNERPREKLLQKGASALSDAELIAIFLRHGHKGKTAVDLARDVLVNFKDLHTLLESPLNAIISVKGMGPAKYVELQAALEIGRRYLQERVIDTQWVQNSDDTCNFIKACLKHQQREVFACLFLDNRHRIMCYEELFYGTLHTATVHPREVVKRALQLNAAALILAHNHPSGSCQPSHDDIQLTKYLQRALDLIDVRIIDHIVVGDAEVVSMAELGLINTN